MILHSLVITAGLSSRMGKFKPLLIYQNEPIIISIIKKLIPFSQNVFVVTGFKEEEVIKTIEDYFPKTELKDKIVVVSNHNYEKGMFTSLQRGLSKAGNCDWLLYHFVDQPLLPENFYSDFINQIDDEYNWIQPSFNDKRGHPVLIRKTFFNSIIQAEENSSLKEITKSENMNKKIWNCHYKEILVDIDTLEDYNAIME